MSLENTRKEINEIDRQMAELFVRRMRAVESVADYKAKNGIPVLDEEREKQVITRNASYIEDDRLRDYYVAFIRDTMRISRTYQHQLLDSMCIAYCGVEGAFAQIAAHKLFPSAQLISYGSFEQAYAAVESRECHCAVLPIENSYAGEVGQVTDLLFSGSLHVSGVYDLAIRHQLLALPGSDITNVRRVFSHAQALQQCAPFIREHGMEPVSCSNTAVAAKQVADGGDMSVAAIASEETAALYGLDVIARNINESAWNSTRFAVLTPAPRRPDKKCGVRTLLFFSVGHQAGSLARAVSVIGKHGYNMLSLRSRALKDLLWQYYFTVEMEGDGFTAQGQEMMQELSTFCTHLKIVGVYPDDVTVDAFREE